MKNGFTLIELLAVIVILGVIATITMFATGAIIKDAKENLSSAQKTKLKEAAELYYLENPNASHVCIQTLIDTGYIEAEQVLDPKNREVVDGYVSITKSGNRVTYEYVDDNSLCNN